MESTDHTPAGHRARRRFAPLIWLSGALAAVLLVLGINGSLSDWTTAIIHNDQNSAASDKAVALSESSGGTTCVDTATDADNEATCSTVNKYGGVSGGGQESAALALSPGDTPRTTTVTLANTGTGAGDLVLGAATCGNSVNNAATGGDTTADYDLCDVVEVSVACAGDAGNTGSSTLAATTPVVLSAFTGATLGDLDPGDSTACTFTVDLPASTPSGYSNQLASQVLTWTLTAS